MQPLSRDTIIGDYDRVGFAIAGDISKVGTARPT